MIRRLVAIAFLMLGLAVAYVLRPSAPPPVSPYLPPLHLAPAQSITVGADAKAVTAADLNRDGADDLVITHFSNVPVVIDTVSYSHRPLSVTILINRSPGTVTSAPTYNMHQFDVVTDKLLRDLRISGEPSADSYWFDRLFAGHVAVGDVDGDRLPDLAITVPQLRKIAVVYNQGPKAAKPFNFIPFDAGPAKTDLRKTIVINSPTAETAMPLISLITDADGDNQKDLVCYAAYYGPTSPTVKPVEYLMMIPGTAPDNPREARYAFDPSRQIRRWKSDFHIGLGRRDRLREGTKLFDHSLPITGTPFYDAPSDRLIDPGVASHLMNAGRILRASEGNQDDPRSTVWMAGERELYSFRYDSSSELFVLADQMDNVGGRGTGFDIFKIGDRQALLMRGGKEIRYEPWNDKGTVTRSRDIPVLSGPSQLGSWVKYVPYLGGAPALLSLFRYKRPGEGASAGSFDYESLGSGKSKNENSLLLVERAGIITGSDGKYEVAPLLEDVNRDTLQALTVAASAYQQPAIEVVNYGKKRGQAMLVMESGRLSFYQVNDPSYTAPDMRIDYAQSLSNPTNGYAGSDLVALGDERAAFAGNFSSDDPPRYAIVRRAGAEVALLPVSPLVAIGAKSAVIIIGLNEFKAGDDYSIELINSGASTGEFAFRIMGR